MPPDKPIAPEFKPGAAEPRTVSDAIRVWQNVTPRAEQVSFCRILVDFRDAAFELARRNREKNSFFVQYFMGDFCFLRQSGPEILLPGRKNPSPEKEIPGSEKKIPSPEIFFPSPVFFRRWLGSPFSRYLELLHRQIPDVNMSAQVPPGLRAPVIPARKQPAPATKRKPAPSICRHLGFRTRRETAFFAPATAPCPVQVNLRGLQMTKCQIPREIAKCQIRRSVSAGKHENVLPR